MTVVAKSSPAPGRRFVIRRSGVLSSKIKCCCHWIIYFTRVCKHLLQHFFKHRWRVIFLYGRLGFYFVFRFRKILKVFCIGNRYIDHYSDHLSQYSYFLSNRGGSRRVSTTVAWCWAGLRCRKWKFRKFNPIHQSLNSLCGVRRISTDYNPSHFNRSMHHAFSLKMITGNSQIM